MESVLSYLDVNSGNQTQVTRLTRQTFHLLSRVQAGSLLLRQSVLFLQSGSILVLFASVTVPIIAHAQQLNLSFNVKIDYVVDLRKQKTKNGR